MTAANLQPLERITDLRSVWSSESGDFTPWLAEHLDELAAELGLDLELTQAEGAVGAFRVDLVARDLGRDRVVIIENQLESTDHTHLGQLLTYASGLDAATVVWIASTVRPEHRQAVDWLNQHTDEHLHFFAVKLGLIRIGNSPLAAHFVVEAAPNNWQKSVSRDSAVKNVSPRAQRYQTFWQGVIDELREEHRMTNAKVGQPQSWYAFASGTAGVRFVGAFRSGDRIGAEVYIDTGDDDTNLDLFNTLKPEQADIHQEMGEAMHWQELPDRRACRITTDHPGSIDSSVETLAELHRHVVDRLLRIDRVFRPRIQAWRNR